MVHVEEGSEVLMDKITYTGEDLKILLEQNRQIKPLLDNIALLREKRELFERLFTPKKVE